MKHLVTILSRLAVVWMLGLVCSSGLAQQPLPQPSPGAGAQTDSARRQETFELVWKTVNQTFYDPTFGGVDWKAVHDRYAPLIARVDSDVELHLLLQGMINELHQSHFFVIPPQAIPKFVADTSEETDAADDEEEAIDDLTSDTTTPLETIKARLTKRLSTGIGIDLRVINGMAVITRVDPGSSGARAGLRPGLQILSVNGKSLSQAVAEIGRNPIWHEIIRPELPDFLIARYINGTVRAPVKLVYVDGINRQHIVMIPRQKLGGEMSPAMGNLPPMYTEFEARRLAGGFGYIRFNAFVPILMKKVCSALRSMHDTPGLVIDLRGNHGGLVAMISGLTGLLETSTQLVGSMETRQGRNPMLAYPQRSPYTGALVILIDSTSQSAAEMFAAALQENGRAQIVGEMSAGNVIPSAIIKLPTGALLQYGFAKYVTPHGNVLEAHGLVPDWIVLPTKRTLLAGGDPQLTAAVKKLREKIGANRVPEIVGEITVNALPTSGSKASPAVEDPPPPPPAPAPAPANRGAEKGPSSQNLAATRQVIDKYLAAIGGEIAFRKLTNRVSTGTVELPGMDENSSTELYEDASGRWAIVMNIEGMGTLRNVFDGKARWMQHPLEGLVTYPTSPGTYNEDTFQKEIAVKKLKPFLQFSGIEQVGGRNAMVLSRQFSGGGTDKLFFDLETGLLVRRNSTYYEDYREVDGVKLPFTTREESPGGSVVLRMKEIKHNVPIDQNWFKEVPDCFTAPGKTN